MPSNLTLDGDLLSAGMRHGSQDALQRVRDALLVQPTYPLAAASLGWSEATLRRWLDRYPELRPDGWGRVGWPKGRKRKSA